MTSRFLHVSGCLLVAAFLLGCSSPGGAEPSAGKWEASGITRAAGQIKVTNAAELNKATKGLVPGDTLVLAAGEWKDLDLRIAKSGTAQAPITVRAEEAGRVIVTGNSGIVVAGEHVTVADLYFRNVDRTADSDAIVSFDASAKTPAAHSRLTNCFFDHCNPPDVETRYPWVSLGGTNNRVDHCRFEGMNHSGVTVQVRVTGENPGHIIDHNYFLNRPKGTGNGFECIQIGQSQDSRKVGGCLVEANLFEQCDGETEIVSVKTCKNIVRGNTFLRSDGTVTLRHGTESLVEGNHFIGEGKEGAGGIRIIDKGHRVVGNYFEGLDAVTGGIIVFYCGIPKSALNGYFPADGAVVEGNTIVNCNGPTFELRAGYMQRNRTIIPKGIAIRRNVIVQPDAKLPIFSATEPGDVAVEGNVRNEGSTIGRDDIEGFTAQQVSVSRKADGLLHPGSESITGPLPEPLDRKDVGPGWATGGSASRK